MSHPIPFMKANNTMAPKAAKKEAPDLEEAIEEEDEADLVETPEVDEDEIDLKKDKYIKQPKAKKATKKKTADDDDDDKPKRGRPQAKATGAKGRAKK